MTLLLHPLPRVAAGLSRVCETRVAIVQEKNL